MDYGRLKRQFNLLRLALFVAAGLALCVVLAVPELYASPAKKKEDISQQKRKTEREIADTQRKIDENKGQINEQLDHLSNIDSQIERQQQTIDELNATIEELNERMDELSDSIVVLSKLDSLMSVQVAEGLRRRHVQRLRMPSLVFISGASSVAEARQRFNYLNKLQNAKNRRVADLRHEREKLENTRAELSEVQASHASAVKQLATAKDILDGRRDEAQHVVDDLRKEGQSLNRVLAEKKRRAQQLDNELNRIINDEQRRNEQDRKKKQNNGSQQASQSSSGSQSQSDPAQQKLTGSFASNKGKLLFPVAGSYTIVGTFGRSQHSELDHVEVDNSGIDISVAKGTTARAVFDGTVSSVFFMENYENIIILRHGEYLTVYAGLSSLKVAKGDKVKAGQTLGTIATIDGKTILHFEVRKEREKLNPLQWVK